MIIKKAEFVMSCVRPEQYPNDGFPEVAFAGRSNVGKSSFINVLANRKNLAKVGKTPGVTNLINYFNINDSLYFVDLPGYGYAARSKEEREAWGHIIETYLDNREQLKAIIMMVDIRHKPTEDDVLMYNWIKFRDFPHFIAASKADKIPRSKYNERLKEIRSTLMAEDSVKILPVSSDKKTGIDDAWDLIEMFIKE